MRLSHILPRASLLALILGLSPQAFAGCYWQWQGLKSHFVCEPDTPTVITDPDTPASPMGKLCGLARRGVDAKDSYSFYAYHSSPSASFDQICHNANQARLDKGLNKPATHREVSQYRTNAENTAAAYCANGTWRRRAYGIQALKDVNAVRKQGGGYGCILKFE